MPTSTDIFLGTFLIICGFILSLINLHRIVKKRSGNFNSVLLSENLLLTCIGIAFVSRSLYNLNLTTIEDMETRSATLDDYVNNKESAMKCNFMSVLMGYGPLIVSLVNSFITLMIDNYMHYRVIEDNNKKEDENIVLEMQRSNAVQKENHSFFTYLKVYFPVLAAVFQWMVPIVLVVSMYPIEVKWKAIRTNEFRSLGPSCMTMLDMVNETCFFVEQNNSLELRNHLLPGNYLNVYENDQNLLLGNNSASIKSVVDKIYTIVNSFDTDVYNSNVNVSSQVLLREPKSQNKCFKMCYLETKSLLLYMFLLCVISYFVPITISAVILTKIHVLNTKNSNIKMYVNRELFYNILFWTPVMFDTFLSLIFCSYEMNGTRTSIFHVIANVYQVVKNFMNTKYFKDNAVVPV